MSPIMPGELRGEGTTVRATILPTGEASQNYRRLLRGPGEPLGLRSDFGGSGTHMRLRSLACFVQVSDLHVADVQSPARAEFLDRLGDADSCFRLTHGRNRTYRAQEPFTHHVVEAMVHAVNSVSGGPLTGAAISFAVSTGDAADNCQGNELANYVALLDGGREIFPDSGDRSLFDGVSSHAHYDVRYWHPDGTPAGEQDDLPRSLYGFPTINGVLDACRQPFVSSGLNVPWYAVYGNHDALVGGIYAPSEAFSTLASGENKPLGFANEVDLSFLDGNEIGRDFGDITELALQTRKVHGDASRALVSTKDWLGAHLRFAGRPHGHGFDATAVEQERAYYGFDLGEIRFLVLDTVNRSGGWQGSIDDDQLSWLEDELIGGHTFYFDRSDKSVVRDGADRLFILFSHHRLEDLTNCYEPNGALRHSHQTVAALLHRFPNVIGWLNGHTHENAATAIRPRDKGRRGFWEVTCASHIDWPQQCRVIEIAYDDVTGDLVMATSCIDHAGYVDPRRHDLFDPLTLAGWSRELAANAWQARTSILEPVGRGGTRDRNVALLMPAPYKIGRDL